MENIDTSKLGLNHGKIDQDNLNSNNDHHSLIPAMKISKKYMKKPTVNSYTKIRTIAHHKASQIIQIKKKTWLGKKFEKSYPCEKLKQSQKILYLILEDPSSSYIGQFILLIIISTIIFTAVNAILLSRKINEDNLGNKNSFRSIVDNCSSFIFLLEYILRLWCCTAFDGTLIDNIKKPIMIIDFIAIIPFIVQELSAAYNFYSINIARILILIKILTILKIARYLKGSQLFWEGIKSSLASFGFLLLSLIIANIVFAICYYFAEHNMLEIEAGNTCVVTSIPDAMWWALTTMTTVGYGDKYPLTTTGKFISGLTALTGMLMIALPVAILGINFQRVYDIKLENSRIKRLKKAILKNDSSLTEDQKEILFMNQRMKALAHGSTSIKELLIKSDVLYHKVENEIKTLYTALYAEQKQIESIKDLDSDLFGMKGKIKIMERLKRAKKKIKLMQIVRKFPDYINGNSLSNSPKRSPRKYPNSLSKEKVESPKHFKNVNKVKETPILTTMEKLPILIKPVNNENENTKQSKKYQRKKPIDFKKDLEDEPYEDPKKIGCLDDIRSNDNECILPIAAMKNYNNNREDTFRYLSDEIRHSRSKNKVASRVFIKANSQDDENSFIKYKIKNLDFLSNHRLNELILCDSSSDIDDSQIQYQNDLKMDLNPHENPNLNNLDSHSETNQLYDPALTNKIISHFNTGDKTTTCRRSSKKLPENINLQSKTFKLAEKIFEDHFLKIYEEYEENQTYSSANVYSSNIDLNIKRFVNPFYQINELPDSNSDNSKHEITSLIKDLCYLDGPKAKKVYTRLKTRKVLEENEDFMINLDDSYLRQQTMSRRMDYFEKGNLDKLSKSISNISNQSSPRIIRMPKPQNRSSIFRKLETNCMKE